MLVAAAPCVSAARRASTSATTAAGSRASLRSVCVRCAVWRSSPVAAALLRSASKLTRAIVARATAEPSRCVQCSAVILIQQW
eukprot:20705-Heterococcus_DN1.PRE.1